MQEFLRKATISSCAAQILCYTLNMSPIPVRSPLPSSLLPPARTSRPSSFHSFLFLARKPRLSLE